MAIKKGLALPCGSDKHGRADTVTGSDQTRKLIIVGLQPDESDNPFQGFIGIDEDVFTRDLPIYRAAQERRIRELFRELESEYRAKIDSKNPFLWTKDQDGRPIVTITYYDMEADRETDISVPLKGAA